MINGQNISAEKPSDINLKVTKNSGAIPGGAVANVAGERENLQFSLAMEKDPEAVLTLSLPLDTAKAGSMEICSDMIPLPESWNMQKVL